MNMRFMGGRRGVGRGFNVIIYNMYLLVFILDTVLVVHLI